MRQSGHEGWDELVLLAGPVVRGDGRGRQLGYPTANVAVPDAEMPPESELPDGVYAGVLRRADGSLEAAAVSIGRRPTYYGRGAARLVEAYLLDASPNLYDEVVELLVGPFVRGQRRFSSSEELVAQMAADVAAIRRLSPQRVLPSSWG